LPFHDYRLHELFFRYRARNFRDTLTSDEIVRWDKYRSDKFKDEGSFLKFESDLKEATLSAEKSNTETGRKILTELKKYANQVKDSLIS